MNEAFTFYGSFYDAIRELSDGDRLAVYDAICSYGITGKVPELSGVAAMAFKLMRPNIDANLVKRASGQKGGKSKTEANAKQTESTSEADANQQNITEQNKTEQNKKENKRFAPPSVDDVREYIAEKGYAVDAEAFVDFYASKGWRVGNQSMKDWRSAVRTWQRRSGDARAPAKKQTYRHFDYERKDTDYDELQRRLSVARFAADG